MSTLVAVRPHIWSALTSQIVSKVIVGSSGGIGIEKLHFKLDHFVDCGRVGEARGGVGVHDEPEVGSYPLVHVLGA